MSAMFASILKVLLLLISLLMTFMILLQEGKGGGLVGLGGTKAAGVEGVTNPIRRFTGYLAAGWFLIAIVLGVMARGEVMDTDQEGLYDPEQAVMSGPDKKKDPETKAPAVKVEKKAEEKTEKKEETKNEAPAGKAEEKAETKDEPGEETAPKDKTKTEEKTEAPSEKAPEAAPKAEEKEAAPAARAE